MDMARYGGVPVTQEMQEKLAHVLQARPALAQLFRCETPVGEYASALLRDPGQPGPLRPAVGAFVVEYARRLLGGDIAARCERTFRLANTFSSADHHGPITHSLLVNGNLVYALGHDREREVQLVLSCAGVPLSNLSYPRGLYCRGRRVPLLPSRFQNSLVLRAPAADRHYFETAVARSGLGNADRAYLIRLWSEIREDGCLQSAAGYSEQVSILNVRLWREYFAVDVHVPPLVYVPLEEIVAHLIVEGHLDDEPLFRSILFDPEVRAACLEAFEGVAGAWSGDLSGSHFFWGIAEDGSSYRLRAAGDRLAGRRGAFPLTPRELSMRLRDRRIYPGLFVNYLVLMFLAGIVLVGGFNQVSVLTELRGRLAGLAQSLGLKEHARRILRLNTSGLICGPALVELGGLEPDPSRRLTRADLAAAAARPLRELLLRNLDGIHSVVS